MIFAYYFQWTWIVRTWVIRYTRTTASYNLTTRVRECRLPIHHVTTGMNQFYLLIGLGVNPFHLLIGPYLYRIVCISCFLLFVKCLMCWDRGRPNVLMNSLNVNTITLTYIHPFNGPLSGTTQLSWYQKGKTIWILLKQETVSGSGISWAICKSAPCSRQITTPAPHHLVFAGQMPFLPPNQQRQSTEGNKYRNTKCSLFVIPVFCCV